MKEVWDICLVGLDNSSVGWSFHKGWSPSRVLLSMVSGTLLRMKERIFVGIDIPTLENVADCPSRNDDMSSSDALRREACTVQRLAKGARFAEDNLFRLRWIHQSTTE